MRGPVRPAGIPVAGLGSELALAKVVGRSKQD